MVSEKLGSEFGFGKCNGNYIYNYLMVMGYSTSFGIAITWLHGFLVHAAHLVVNWRSQCYCHIEKTEYW